MVNSRSFWVTGSTSGLGAAIVEQLVEAHQPVAASGRNNHQFHAIGRRHGSRLLALTEAPHLAAERIQAKWGALDTLIVNAGTCDYLPAKLADGQLVQALITTNMDALDSYLSAALPLLNKGRKPQVLVILNLYTATQLSDPGLPATNRNSLPQQLKCRRQSLKNAGIDLTVVTPYAQPGATTTCPVPEHWTASSAAAELLARLPERKNEIVLEALGLRNLWPLMSV